MTKQVVTSQFNQQGKQYQGKKDLTN